jgi:hypothetical protein
MSATIILVVSLLAIVVALSALAVLLLGIVDNSAPLA